MEKVKIKSDENSLEPVRDFACFDVKDVESSFMELDSILKKKGLKLVVGDRGDEYYWIKVEKREEWDDEREFFEGFFERIKDKPIYNKHGYYFFNFSDVRIRWASYLPKEKRPDNSGHVDFDIYAGALVQREDGANVEECALGMNTDGEFFLILYTKQDNWIVYRMFVDTSITLEFECIM